MADNVIGVRTNTVLSREIKDWPKKRIAVEGQRLFHHLPYHLQVDLLILSCFLFCSSSNGRLLPWDSMHADNTEFRMGSHGN